MIRQPRIPRPSFFRAHSPKGFDYSPRTYDPEKERLEELKRRMRHSKEGIYDDKGAAARIRDGIRHRRSTSGTNWNYLIRLVLILSALIAVIKYVLAG